MVPQCALDPQGVKRKQDKERKAAEKKAAKAAKEASEPAAEESAIGDEDLNDLFGENDEGHEGHEEEREDWMDDETGYYDEYGYWIWY